MSAARTTAVAVPTTENCRFCWMCRQACPVGHVTNRETYTPHAWALTIESVKRGQLQWNAETTGVLYACADCGLCQSHCATDQPLPDAITSERASVAAAGLAPASVYDLDEKLHAWGNPYGAAAAAGPPARGDVALFVGDAAHYLRPASVDAAVALLAAVGVTAVPVGVGRSTGSVAASLGLRATAISLADAVMADVRATGARDLLVLSPGDRWTFQHVYPARLDLPWPADIVVKEVVTVLADALADGRVRFRQSRTNRTYAYHDPCHSPRIDRDAAAPRALLAAALGASDARALFWREGRAHPCGATGGLEFTHPDIAARLADARVSDASSAGAQWLVTEDAACQHHLGSKQAADVEVRGMYELLAERVEPRRR